MSRYFGADQRAQMTAIVDRLIPAEGDHPSASEAGTVDYIDGAIAGSKRLPRLFSSGLHLVDMEAARAGGARFVDIRGELQDQVLRKIESESKEFFEALLGFTYNGYYSNPAVVETLGLDPRPPQPRGNEVAIGDFSSLEDVVRRGQAYRDVT